LLMAAFLYQDSLKAKEALTGNAPLRRTVTAEGAGILQPGSTFNVVRAAYNMFDPENKGHITAADLRRVCAQLGYKVDERDLDNMLSVLAPSKSLDHHSDERAISYDKFATMMESSYRRRYKAGEAVFRQGDPVDGFYILTQGECFVQASSRPGSAPQEVARLGPGDFFGETGLLEGRVARNTDVICSTDVEVLMIDRPMFLQLAEAPEGSAGAAIAEKMRERAEARQRRRLNKAIEMVQSAPLQRIRFRKGDVVFEQDSPASYFYIVASGELESNFISSTGEQAKLGTLGPGDQFGYDAVLGERHDTTVVCTSDVEVLAVPREDLQKSLTDESYLSSVWKAPAQKRMRLRRQMSMALHDSLVAPGGVAVHEKAKPHPDATAERADPPTRLQPADFERLLRRSRVCELKPSQAAFEQGSLPAAVYLLKEGKCTVEVTSKSGETRVLGELTAGDHFGEAALLEGRTRRNSTVRCSDPSGCKVGVLGKHAFEAYLDVEPEVAQVFLAVAAQRQRGRLRTVITMAAERQECSTRRLAKGEVLYRQGDSADAFYLIESGSVQMSYVTEDGRMLPSKVHRKADVFGASGVYGSGTRRDTATALEDCTLKMIPHAHFQAMLRADSWIAEGIRRASSYGVDQNKSHGSHKTHAPHAPHAPYPPH